MKFREKFFVVNFILIIALCFLLFLMELLNGDDWKKETTPLRADTIQTLCKKLSLSLESRLCNGSQNIYAREFAEALEKNFLPKDGNPAKFEDVEEKIGNYKIECQPTVNLPTSGYSYFRCFYDLNGDGYWRYAFYYYYPDNTLFRIMGGTSND